jgi:CelD/BcsL family acetyltransferase involved in cellulose biosynthesis
MFPDAALAARWEAAPLAEQTAWGLPLVREGAVLRNAGGSALPGIVPDLGAPLPDTSAARVLVLRDLVDEDAALDRLDVPGAQVHLRYLCWAARFGDDPERFLGTALSTKRRKRLRYDRRQLDKQGEVALRWAAPDEADDLVEHFLRLTAQRAAATGRYDATLRHPDELRAVWRRHVGRELLVSVLSVDGRPVSFRTGFAAGERYLGYMPAIDRDLDGVSVGDLHMALLLPELAALGLTSYHMGKGGLGNKEVWATHPYVMATVVVPLDGSPAARALALAEAARERARRAVTASGLETPLRRGIQRALTARDTPYRRALEELR